MNQLKQIIYRFLYKTSIYKHQSILFSEFIRSIKHENKYSTQDIKNWLGNITTTTPPEEILNLNNSFKDIYANSNTKLAFLLPEIHKSAGGYSLITNIHQGLVHLGLKSHLVPVGPHMNTILSKIHPDILFAFDFDEIFNLIHWKPIKERGTKIGIAAYIDAYKYMSPLKQRMKNTNKIGIDFYYTFKKNEYVRHHMGYAPIVKSYLPIISFEFGANPLHYYPIKREKSKDYIFIGSTNRDKWGRYAAWFSQVYANMPNGIIYGPGWPFCTDFEFNQNIEREAYARTKVGLNLHLQNQIDYASELNERTYQLALCNVPQLTDNPKALDTNYPSPCIYSADTPQKYANTLKYMLKNLDEAQSKAQIAYRHTLSHHTSFHRAQQLYHDLIAHKLISK